MAFLKRHRATWYTNTFIIQSFGKYDLGGNQIVHSNIQLILITYLAIAETISLAKIEYEYSTRKNNRLSSAEEPVHT